MADELNQTPPWEAFSGTLSQEESLSSSQDSESVSPENAELVEEIAAEFMGFWNTLISQTNWKKGEVILTWRNRLVASGLPRGIWSDESLARRIGNVSSQHVGRLRRVFERFGDPQKYRENSSFAHLYWSHYQAALDWDDADQWLMKASSESLSVAQMRMSRWEVCGSPADRKPKPEEIVAAEPDEDVNPMNDADTQFVQIEQIETKTSAGAADESETKEKGEAKKASKEGNDSSNSANENGASLKNPTSGSDEVWKPTPRTTDDVLRSMASLPELPSTLSEPVNSLKLAILDQRLAGWEQEEQEATVVWLRALADLAASKDA